MKNIVLTLTLLISAMSYGQSDGFDLSKPVCTDNPTLQDFKKAYQPNLDLRSSHIDKAAVKVLDFDPKNKKMINDTLIALCLELSGFHGSFGDICMDKHKKSISPYSFDSSTRILSMIVSNGYVVRFGSEFYGQDIKILSKIDFSVKGETRVLSQEINSIGNVKRNNILPNPNPENYPYKLVNSFMVDEKNKIAWEIKPTQLNGHTCIKGAILDCGSRGMRLPTTTEYIRLKNHHDFCHFPEEDGPILSMIRLVSYLDQQNYTYWWTNDFDPNFICSDKTGWQNGKEWHCVKDL